MFSIQVFVHGIPYNSIIPMMSPQRKEEGERNIRIYNEKISIRSMKDINGFI